MERAKREAPEGANSLDAAVFSTELSKGRVSFNFPAAILAFFRTFRSPGRNNVMKTDQFFPPRICSSTRTKVLVPTKQKFSMSRVCSCVEHKAIFLGHRDSRPGSKGIASDSENS